MQILYVHECRGALAGAEANVAITAEELRAAGHEVALLHTRDSGRDMERWERIFPRHFSLENTSPAAGTSAALADFQPDVIYVHKMSDLSVLERLTRGDYPLVRMVHDHDIYCLRSYKYNYFTREICTKPAGLHCIVPCLGCFVKNEGDGMPVKWASYRDKRREISLNQRFNRMVVVTTYMRDELLKNGFDADKIRIHGPVPRPGRNGVRSNFSERNLIVYAGQIIRGKGVDVLLESLAKVQSPFECIILGDGNHRAFCEDLSLRLGLADRVKFMGFVPQQELLTYYKECSAVALSSLWPEPIATIGLEVMRYALPVVAFDAGGIKDWLIDGHNGRLVPWMDRQAYADAIDELLKDKAKARRMGENGLELVSSRYDFHGYISDLEALFSEVIAEHQQATELVENPSLFAAA